MRASAPSRRRLHVLAAVAVVLAALAFYLGFAREKPPPPSTSLVALGDARAFRTQRGTCGAGVAGIRVQGLR